LHLKKILATGYTHSENEQYETSTRNSCDPIARIVSACADSAKAGAVGGLAPGRIGASACALGLRRTNGAVRLARNPPAGLSATPGGGLQRISDYAHLTGLHGIREGNGTNARIPCSVKRFS
jgi:hypothetical protein